MFRVKICGITTVADAAEAVKAGADAIGLNFFKGSPRYVSPEIAARITDSLPVEIAKVGVFVNLPISEIIAIVAKSGLTAVQLHGDEPPEYVRQLAPRSVIKAFRLQRGQLQTIEEYLDQCLLLGASPIAILLDAYEPGQFGGTGKAADWPLAVEYSHIGGAPPLVLAGGLRPDNVRDAIRCVKPAAVDTASGVELAPGKKDPAKMAAFASAAQAALGA